MLVGVDQAVNEEDFIRLLLQPIESSHGDKKVHEIAPAASIWESPSFLLQRKQEENEERSKNKKLIP